MLERSLSKISEQRIPQEQSAIHEFNENNHLKQPIESISKEEVQRSIGAV